MQQQQLWVPDFNLPTQPGENPSHAVHPVTELSWAEEEALGAERPPWAALPGVSPGLFLWQRNGQS